MSTVHIATLVATEKFPQASNAVNVLTCCRLHPLLNTKSLNIIDGALHSSVALPKPSARKILPGLGLQPRTAVP